MSRQRLNYGTRFRTGGCDSHCGGGVTHAGKPPWMRRKKNGKPRPPIRDEYGHAKRHARRAKVGMPHFKFEDKPLED